MGWHCLCRHLRVYQDLERRVSKSYFGINFDLESLCSLIVSCMSCLLKNERSVGNPDKASAAPLDAWAEALHA